jgi:hypothetical protein
VVDRERAAGLAGPRGLVALEQELVGNAIEDDDEYVSGRPMVAFA